jgi:hypothetical protein
VATWSEEMPQVAIPPDVATALQSVVEPSRKVTEPAGAPSPDVTVAVSVSSRPNVPGLGLAVKVVVVGAAVMVSVWVPSVTPALEAGEVREALIEGDPALVSP